MVSGPVPRVDDSGFPLKAEMTGLRSPFHGQGMLKGFRADSARRPTVGRQKRKNSPQPPKKVADRSLFPANSCDNHWQPVQIHYQSFNPAP